MTVRKTNICAGFRFPANSVTRQVPIVGNAFVKHQPSHCHPTIPSKSEISVEAPTDGPNTLSNSILIFIDFRKNKGKHHFREWVQRSVFRALFLLPNAVGRTISTFCSVHTIAQFFSQIAAAPHISLP